MPQIEGAGVPLEVEVHGPADAAATVLLVHGIGDDRRCFDDVVAALGDARAVAYDRRGYGASGAPEPYLRTTVAEQAEDAAALLTALGARSAIVVGADVGALVALDLLLRHAPLAAAAVLVDVPAFPLVPEANEALAGERVLLEQALHADGPSAAVRAWLAARGVTGERADRAAERPGAFFADFGALATLPLLRRELRAVHAPVVVLDGPAAPEHLRAAGDALAALLPAARRGGREPVADAVRSLMVSP